ncbi:MAG: hypothetical protein M3014_09285, partial [Chloroflexota bacterium]|nr:hypothetical protein [Chloroflexota bacterium]
MFSKIRNYTLTLALSSMVAAGLAGCGGDTAQSTATPVAAVATVAATAAASTQAVATVAVTVPAATVASGAPGATAVGTASDTGSGTGTGIGTPGAGAAVTYTTYTDPAKSYIIDLPASWATSEITGGLSISAPADAGEKTVPMRILITAIDVGQKVSPMELSNATETQLKVIRGDSYKNRSTSHMGNATMVDYTFEVSGTEYRALTDVEQRGTILYNLTIFNISGTNYKYNPIIDHVRASFKIVNASGTGMSGLGLDTTGGASTPGDTTTTPAPGAATSTGGSASTPGAALTFQGKTQTLNVPKVGTVDVTVNSLRHETTGQSAPKSGRDYVILNVTIKNNTSTIFHVSFLADATLTD